MALQALLLCDSAVTDAITTKISLHGIFHVVNSRQFPCVQPRCFIYYMLILLPGSKAQLSLEYVYASGQRDAAFALPTLVADAGGSVQGLVELQDLPFNEPGAYYFELFANGELQGKLRIFANRTKEESRARAN